MPIERTSFGVLETGEEASLFLLDAGDCRISLTDYGAALVSIFLPDGRGGRDDILLGCSTLAGYAENSSYFGATVGRFANRIGRARFSLGGREYLLDANDGSNHLHGGSRGFHTRVWPSEPFEQHGAPAVRFARTSPDGEEGYPGTLDAAVTFRLSADGSVTISYEAQTDAETVVNLTNHAYFNLRGEGRGLILDHELSIAASRYLPVDAGLIPLGPSEDVSGGPFDFRRPKPIGRDLAAAGGYDHCFLLDRRGAGLFSCAEVFEPVTRRRMTVATTLPGIQFYSGNFLEGARGKRGTVSRRHGGFCLETELFPDSPNRPGYPSCVLRPGEKWEHETVYRFLA